MNHKPDILETLAAAARRRVEHRKEKISAADMEAAARALPKKDFAFEKALQKPGVSLICECKKASPSKGLIAKDYDALHLAQAYEAAGADCISVLTEPQWFLGSRHDLESVCSQVQIPVLRKDFTVDPYMIYEARVLGADAVLLIASLLSDEELHQDLVLCDELGLSALCEAHDEEEIRRLITAGARLIGVNNRNLKTFQVDESLALSFRKAIPDSILFISESGIQGPRQIEELVLAGVDGALIGELLVRSENLQQTLANLQQAAQPLLPKTAEAKNAGGAKEAEDSEECEGSEEAEGLERLERTEKEKEKECKPLQDEPHPTGNAPVAGETPAAVHHAPDPDEPDESAMAGADA